MKKDTVTLKTDTLAELMGMALLAANAGLLPADTYEEWFKLRFRREIEFTIDGLKNGWGREDIGALNNLTDSWVQRFKARKTFEKNLEACFGEKEKAEVKTTIGELVGYFDGYYLVDKGEEGTWLTKGKRSLKQRCVHKQPEIVLLSQVIAYASFLFSYL